MEKIWTSIKTFFRRAAIIVTLLIVLGTTGYLLFARYAAYSDGFRVGKVIKFSRKGKVIKTYEGEMNLGGVRTNADGDLDANIWQFSIYGNDDELREEIERAAERGYRVKLLYKEKYVKIFFWGDSKYFIHDIERIRDVAPSEAEKE